MDSDKQIHITNTGTVIVPYKKRQSVSLERMTSMKDFGCKFKRIEVTGFNIDGLFLTHHLPKFLLDNDFPGYVVTYHPPMEAKKFPTDVRMEISEEYSLSDPQYLIVESILRDTKNSRWFVNCPQGFGKTLISTFIISQFRLNALIMCYSTAILRQWREKIYEYTNIPMERVLSLDSGALITSIIEDAFPIQNYNLFISTPKLITQYANKHGFDKIHKLFTKLGIGIKIYDEAHRDLANIIKIDALSSVANTLYLSGDFAQASKYKSKFFYQMFSGVRVVKPDQETLNDLRYTKAVIVEYNTHPSDLEVISVFGKRGLSIWDYMEYQIRKGTLIKVINWILDHITQLKESDRRILILTSMIEHCDLLYNLVSDRYNEYNVGKIHGDMSIEHNADVKNNAQIIVSTYNSFSTGMDTHNIKYVISTSVSNRVEDSQASGRARPLSDGEDCMFWMLVDTGFDRVVQKEQERIEYLKNVKVKDVTKISYYE